MFIYCELLFSFNYTIVRNYLIPYKCALSRERLFEITLRSVITVQVEVK